MNTPLCISHSINVNLAENGVSVEASKLTFSEDEPSGIGILRRYGPGCRVSDGLGARHHIFDFVRAPVLKRGNQMEGMPLREV